MYPGPHASARANQSAFIMAGSGEAVTYAELEARSNALAHVLRAQGLKRLDHYAIFMENNARYVETCAAGERAGLYYTCVNSYLTAEELAYILQNSESKVLITSAACQDVALAALEQCPAVALCLVVGGTGGAGRVRDYEQAVAAFPAIPIPDEALGTAMFYSSGTTGRPKGILRPLPVCPPAEG
jgi:long-chain acyl-CoA synthetase